MAFTDNNLRNEKLQRLRGGLLLGKIIKRMDKMNEGKLGETLQMYAYSKHGVGIAALLANLGFIPPETWPSSASVVLVELHSDEAGKHFVEVYYKNVSETTVTSVAIEDCPDPCTLEQFKERSAQYVFIDWKKECGIGTSWEIYLGIFCALLLLLVLLLLGCVVYKKHQRRNAHLSGAAYSEVRTEFPSSSCDKEVLE